MAIQGLRDSEQFITNQRPQNFREGLMLLFPNGKAPLTALTSLMRSKSTDDPRFAWFEKVMNDQRLPIDTSSNLGTGTTITVTSGASALKDGHVLYVEETGERMLVNGDPSSDTSITVIRGYAGGPAATDVAFTTGNGLNEWITVVGSAYEEGSLAPTGISFDPTEYFNYTQIFRNTLEATRTAAKTRLRTGDAVKEAKREALLYHSVEIERALWFGSRDLTTRNNKPLRTTAGILSQIPASRTHVWGTDDASTGVNSTDKDLEAFEELLAQIVFEYGSDEKMAWCGNRSLLTIQQLVRKNASYELVQGQKEFGMNVSRLVSPFGELVLKRHPLFTRMKGGTQGGTRYEGMNASMVITDMEDFIYRHFSGDDMRFESKLEDNGLDGEKSGYITEAGLEMHHQSENHLWIQDFAGAATDAA